MAATTSGEVAQVAGEVAKHLIGTRGGHGGRRGSTKAGGRNSKTMAKGKLPEFKNVKPGTKATGRSTAANTLGRKVGKQRGGKDVVRAGGATG